MQGREGDKGEAEKETEGGQRLREGGGLREGRGEICGGERGRQGGGRVKGRTLRGRCCWDGILKGRDRPEDWGEQDGREVVEH